MRLIASILAAAIAAAAACPTLARGEPLTISDCLDATCKVVVDEGGGKIGSGTGCVFAVGADTVYVLTAAHVVGRHADAQCIFWRAGHESVPLRAQVAAAVETQSCDAAVIAVPASAFGGLLPRAIPLAPAGLRVAPAGTLGSVGCAYGGWETAWKGHALGYADDELQFVPPPAEGRSGSALIDLERGCIVGVIRGRTINEPQSRGVAVPMDLIHGQLIRTSCFGSAGGRALTQAVEPITGNPTRMLEPVRLANEGWEPVRDEIATQCPGGVCPISGGCPGGVCPQPGGYGGYSAPAAQAPPRTFLLPERERVDDRLRALEARPYPTLPATPIASRGDDSVRPLPSEASPAVEELQRRMGDVERRTETAERNINALADSYTRIRDVGETLSQEFPQVKEAIAQARGEATAAGRAAEDAKQENLSLKERLEQRVEGVKALFWAWLPWLIAGVVVAVVIGLIRRDVRQRVESGGADKLAIERLAARTPWTWDDVIAARAAGGLAGVYQWAHPAAPPVTPVATAVAPAATAPAAAAPVAVAPKA